MEHTFEHPSPPSFARLRRLRRSEATRSLIAETSLPKSCVVAPLFITDVPSFVGPISALPGIARLSVTTLLQEVDRLGQNGIDKIALFPLIDPSLKDAQGSEAHQPHGLIQSAIRSLKKRFPDVCILSDIALDPYTSHGHDGIIFDGQTIDNDATIEALAKQAISHAEAGADFIAPSDMMDGRVAALRKALDSTGHSAIGILSYTAKYASSLYGPFRSAINTSLSFGDKKGYQMQPGNKQEAVREALADQAEGADLLMVKPALSYLDVIQTLTEKITLPVGGYHVSGEYAMVMAAHEKGILDGPAVLYEHLLSIRRAGASFIYTYAYDLI